MFILYSKNAICYDENIAKNGMHIPVCTGL